MRDCELNLPYPPLKTSGNNFYYASLLSNDYAGAVSELSAVTSYSYQQFITRNEKIAKTLQCISIVEMHHLEILGKLIDKLGGNPRFAVQIGSRCNFWNAQNICYERNPRRYLKENIANEQAAIAAYRQRIRQIQDTGIQAVLERIILDEEHHINLFSALLKEFY